MSRSPLLTEPRRRRTTALVALLTLAAGAGTYLQGGLSVLSSSVIAEFDINRSQLGLAFTAFSATGALGAPLAGKLADLSAKRVLMGLFAASATGIVAAALSPAYGVLLIASMVGGLALAAGNPVTNRVISDEISPSRHGVAIGVKQAGPPLALLAAGVVLPPAVALFGWRWALALTAVLPLAGLAVTPRLVGAPPTRTAAGEPTAERARGRRRAMWWLWIIGFLTASGIGAVIAFVPLYAQEDVGFSASVAGSLAALIGLFGVAGRIVWGAQTARFSHPTLPLAILGVLALGATGAIWLGGAAPALLWFGVVLAGFSMLAWHAVGWLVLIDAVDVADVGRATGTVQLGNSFGFAAGPPIMGALVDASGSYDPGWGFVLGLFAVATALTFVWRRSLRKPLD